MSERTDRVNDDIVLTQLTEGLTFGTDALLLAGFIDGHAKHAAELGTGTGIISLLLLTRNKADTVTAVEVQAEYAALAEKNAAQNGLSERMRVLNADLRDLAADGSFDLVFTNPPYMKSGSGAQNPVGKKAIARHEIHGGIGDFCLAAKRLLRTGGRFAVVYRAERMADLLAAMRDAEIEPKRLTFVLPDAQSAPTLILVEGKRGANAGLTVTRPLILWRDRTHGAYTEDWNELMERGILPENMLGKQENKRSGGGAK